jgi:hypothetical protein
MSNQTQHSEPLFGSCGIQHSSEAYAYRGLCQDWRPVVKIVRTTSYFSPQYGGWSIGMRHNEETIIIKKQIQFMGRCQS